jgi:hypothetical protein
VCIQGSYLTISSLLERRFEEKIVLAWRAVKELPRMDREIVI